MIEIRPSRDSDALACRDLAARAVGEVLAVPLVHAHLERHHLIVADAAGQVVGFAAYRTDWFQCTYVSLLVVHEDHRRRGIARGLLRSVEAISPSARLFSSTEETDAGAIRAHVALGFAPSGYIDNLPQGVRQLLFYKRLPPRALAARGPDA